MNRFAASALKVHVRPNIRPTVSVARHGLGGRRAFTSSIVGPLSETFIQFGEVLGRLPLPESLPPYSAAIIITTIALRTCTTLPLALWVKLFFEWQLPRAHPKFPRRIVQKVTSTFQAGTEGWRSSKPGQGSARLQSGETKEGPSYYEGVLRRIQDVGSTKGTLIIHRLESYLNSVSLDHGATTKFRPE